MALAVQQGDASPRSWLIVAAARQRQQRYGAAIRAYRLFLESCESRELRDYVVEQMQLCRAVAESAAAPAAPTKQLTAGKLRELAAVSNDTCTESSEHFVVRAKNAKLARLVAAEAEDALKRICGVILAGQDYPHSVEIYVWPDRRDYLAHATDSPEWSGGCFSFIVRNGETTRRIDLTQRDEQGRFAAIMLEAVLPHEMCHLVLREYFGDAVCPVFLNEGLAMLAESRIDSERTVLAGTALMGEKGIPLARLLAFRRDQMTDPAVFYAESFSFTWYLHRRLTKRQFKAFLEHLKGGCPVADGLQRALYVAPSNGFMVSLARAWKSHAVQEAQNLRILRGDEQMHINRAN